MAIDYDPEKRAKTLAERGLDFADAEQIFAGDLIEVIDDRKDYGEVRYQTIGQLHGQIVMVVWTSRRDARRIISMRLCDAQERKLYRDVVLGRS